MCTGLEFYNFLVGIFDIINTNNLKRRRREPKNLTELNIAQAETQVNDLFYQIAFYYPYIEKINKIYLNYSSNTLWHFCNTYGDTLLLFKENKDLTFPIADNVKDILLDVFIHKKYE